MEKERLLPGHHDFMWAGEGWGVGRIQNSLRCTDIFATDSEKTFHI